MLKLFSKDRFFLVAIGRDIRAAGLREVVIPTSVGLASTKTLAKLANHVGKTADRKPGSYPDHLAQVCHLGALEPVALNRVFAATPVRNVWGIGKCIAAKLQAGGWGADRASILRDRIRRRSGASSAWTVA